MTTSISSEDYRITNGQKICKINAYKSEESSQEKIRPLSLTHVSIYIHLYLFKLNQKTNGQRFII